MKKQFNIALAQLDLLFGDPEGNFLKADAAVGKAANDGADLVLLPELWACGYDLDHADTYASSLQQGWFHHMQNMAGAHGIALGGSMIEQDQGKNYNTFALFDQGGSLLGSYRKIHLFQLLNEKKYLHAGSKLVLVDAPWGKTGLAVCYDLRFPEMFRAYAASGAEVILLVAEWPQRRINHWNILIQARAIENQLFIAAVNKVGTNQGIKLGGQSAVINPMGEILVQGGEEEELLLGEINLEDVNKVRRWMPVLSDRQPDLY
ncbi:MAG: carbon-nitrogen family hydrolase [Anaerolineales bacterium]|nr:carbon-nitrogen family hydrolase [Anaerolineales bacterium]